MRPRTSILIAAAIIYAVGAWVPFGQYVLYPLDLFTTWVHEMGHGLTALALGGPFDSLDIYRDGSGLAMCYADAGWREALVCAGGLLAPPIVGSCLLAFVHTPRRAQIVLSALALALVVSLAIFVRSAAGLVAMPLVAAALAWCGWRLDAGGRAIAVQVLGVLLALDTATRMVSYVFMSHATIGGVERASDIQMIADNAGGWYVLWGIAVTAIALGLLAASLWWAWRRSDPTRHIAATVGTGARRR